MRPTFCFFLAAVVLASTALAEVTLAPLFTDHAVIQREAPVPIWGTANPGQHVTVKFGGQSVTSTADNAGEWRVALQPMPANATGQTLTVVGEHTITREDILVGDVWLCGGQSNMEWTVANSRDAEAEIAAADYPLIRHFKVAKRIAAEPIKALSGEWVISTPETAGDFTAVGYFFARRLQADLGVPLGLLNSTWGGTPVEAWLPPSHSEDPALAIDVASHQVKVNEGILAGIQRYQNQLTEWEAARRAADEAQQPFDLEKPNRPWQPGPFKTATVLYNGMIEPLLPYRLAGAIWYQGEGNAGQPETYRSMFGALIEIWREKFEHAEMPFYWAQLASWDNGGGDSTDWGFLREAQHQTLELPHTGQAILMDIGEADDIHPRNKQDVGDRLARIALAEHYGEDVAFRGPVRTSVTFKDDTTVVHFTEATGLTTRDGEPPRGFEIAGADHEFVAVDSATIDGETVVLTTTIENPRYVRYAWRRWVDANLQNGESLPAEPFRTDSK
jgi:sialate O-acetylesterase